MNHEHEPTVAISRYRSMLTDLARTADLIGPELNGESPDQVPEPSDETFEPFYSSVYEWVEEHFTVIYARRRRQTHRWCAKWWAHAEAMLRMEALWRTWEQARLEPVAGIASWLRIELDHHLPILLDENGPFSHCSSDHQETSADPLPICEAPGHARIPSALAG